MVPLVEALTEGLVTSFQAQYIGARMEGPQPDGLNEDLLLASLFGGSLGAGRVRASVPMVRL